MKSLIELYDERPLENVLSAEVFCPERVIYICPKAAAADEQVRSQLLRFFRRRGVHSKLIFVGADIYNSADIVDKLQQVVSHYPDCAIDITGGTDDVLFSAGLVAAANKKLPVFTYSRKRNCFFNIRSAEFLDGMACGVRYSVEDCFVMAGGSMRQGRVDNGILDNYLRDIDPFFHAYLAHRHAWISFISWMQRASAPDGNDRISLAVHAPATLKAERGHSAAADTALLEELEQIGFLTGLEITAGMVDFTFRDLQIRSWLRDVGSVLELYIYKACRDTGLFEDVITSAVVDWEATRSQDAVTNELDVMATRGITPFFISCKTCDVKTEALNELAILKERFGGQIARAAIVTAEPGSSVMRNRAAKLGISVIDLDDLKNGRAPEMLSALAMG